MKRLALLTIPLLAAFAAGPLTAFAATDEVYPENDGDFISPLTFTSLTDYAIEDELFAFADGNTLKVLNGNSYDSYDVEGAFTNVEIKDGEIYCLLDNTERQLVIGEGENYSFKVTEERVCDFKEPVNSLYDKVSCLYFTNENGLNIFDSSTQKTTTYEGEYSNLKIYGDKVYAMKENSLYSFTGVEIAEVKPEYAVKPKNIHIEIGQASSSLKKYASVQFVEIGVGTVMTEVDLDEVSGEYFNALNVVKTNEKTVALLLSSSNDLAIVSIKDKAYAILKPTEKMRNITVNYTSDIPFDTAQISGGSIYASPFVAKGVEAFSFLSAAGIKVSVLNKIESEMLECVFYEVEYSFGESKITGYVAEGLLTPEIREDFEDPDLVNDPHYSDKSDTKTILIILAVVVLVLAVILYVSHVSAKKKKKNKKEEPKEEEK